MKIRRFVTMLAADLFLSAMFYLWQFEGMEQAGNVFMFMIWFCGALGLLVLFAKPNAEAHTPRLKGHSWISGAFTLAFVLGTAWAGQLVAAALYAFSALLMRHFVCESAKLAKTKEVTA